ncbi:hypothetical protein EC973_006890 [Apophysomyces ossiformis]|uniref:MACPF domain-containing protein n=1 Tax=Apophysomyces ossiformis TaxID=679940 RepID=A0A8H7EQR2_9FUNG|nr:hypothetical protein EC973_006890 [Apophysomyces ossiformis]
MSDTWKKGLHLDGRSAEAIAIRVADYNMDRLLIQSDSILYVNNIEVKGENISVVQAFDQEFRMNLPFDVSTFRAGAVATYRQIDNKTHMTVRQTRRSTVYAICAEVCLSPELIAPTFELKLAVNQALARPNQKEKYQALQRVFEQYGYFYAAKLLIGSHIGLKEKKTVDAVSRDRKTGAGIDVEAGPAKATISGSIMDIKTKIAMGIDMSETLEVIGGAHTLLNGSRDLASWAATVHQNPVIVMFKDVRPIYKLLDENQAEQVKEIYEDFGNFDVIRYNRYLIPRHDYYQVPIIVDDLRRVRDYLGGRLYPAGETETDSSANLIFEREYPGRILLAYRDSSDRAVSPTVVKFIPIANIVSASDCYVKRGDTLSIEVTEEGKGAYIYALPIKLAESKYGKCKYKLAPVYRFQKDLLGKNWIIKRYGDAEGDNYLRRNEAVMFENEYYNKCYLSLTKEGAASDKMQIVPGIRRNRDIRGHYIAAKESSKRGPEVRWTFIEHS